MAGPRAGGGAVRRPGRAADLVVGPLRVQGVRDLLGALRAEMQRRFAVQPDHGDGAEIDQQFASLIDSINAKLNQEMV